MLVDSGYIKAEDLHKTTIIGRDSAQRVPCGARLFRRNQRNEGWTSQLGRTVS